MSKYLIVLSSKTPLKFLTLFIKTKARTLFLSRCIKSSRSWGLHHWFVITHYQQTTPLPISVGLVAELWKVHSAMKCYNSSDSLLESFWRWIFSILHCFGDKICLFRDS